MSSSQWATTALGWTVVIGVSGITYFYYRKNDAHRRAIRGRTLRSPSSVSSEPSEPRPSRARRREDHRNTAQGPYDIVSRDVASDGARSRKNKSGNDADHSEFLPLVDDDGEDVSFAYELQNRQKGTDLSQPKRQQNRQRSVRQSNANKRAAEMEVSTASSTTGAEADDDLSPVLSPELQAEDDNKLPSSFDPSDMLEPPAPGPKVLRLTSSGESDRKKPSQPKPQPAPDTKKQRQNRRKAEERRQQNEESEKDRRVLLEKQLRTARESRGEPAKNGIPVAPAKNAWNLNGKVAQVPAANDTYDALLDTFSTNAGSTASSNEGSSTNEAHWEKDLPSEEEQMRRLIEEDESAWKTVAKTKKNRRKNTGDDVATSGGPIQAVDSDAQLTS